MTTWEYNGTSYTGTWRAYLLQLRQQGYKPKTYKKVIQPTYKGLKIKSRRFETTGYSLAKPGQPDIHISEGKYKYFVNTSKPFANE